MLPLPSALLGVGSMNALAENILEFATECMQLADDRSDFISPTEYIYLMELIILEAQKRKAVCEYNKHRPLKGNIDQWKVT